MTGHLQVVPLLVQFSLFIILRMGFPESSVGKESTCIAGDLGLIPGLGRSPGGGYFHFYLQRCSGLSNLKHNSTLLIPFSVASSVFQSVHSFNYPCYYPPPPPFQQSPFNNHIIKSIKISILIMPDIDYFYLLFSSCSMLLKLLTFKISFITFPKNPTLGFIDNPYFIFMSSFIKFSLYFSFLWVQLLLLLFSC